MQEVSTQSGKLVICLRVGPNFTPDDVPKVDPTATLINHAALANIARISTYNTELINDINEGVIRNDNVYSAFRENRPANVNRSIAKGMQDFKTRAGIQ